MPRMNRRIQSSEKICSMFFYLRILHLLVMALWLGATLLSVVDALAARSSAVPGRVQARVAGVVGSVAGLGTVGSGVAMIFLLGGFASVPWAIHAGLSVCLVMILIGAFGIGKSTAALAAAHSTVASPPGELVTRLQRWAIVQLLLWLFVFGLMCFRHLL